jgi:hypothetical protein
MVKLLIGSEHYVYRSDGRIYVHASGTGEESIVFLHAVLATISIFRDMIIQISHQEVIL